MSTQKQALSANIDDVSVVENESAGFHIRWYRCNVCGVDFEETGPSHRRRLQLLLEHKRIHRHELGHN